MRRVLFDQSCPAPLRVHLTGCAVETAFERGWSDLANGLLLKATAGEGFDALVTADKNIRHQQVMTGLPFGTVILGSNIWPVIAADPGRVLAAVLAVRAGEVVMVGFPKPLRRP